MPSSLFGGSYVHLLAFLQRVCGIDNDPIVGTHATNNLQSCTVIPANGDPSELDLFVQADDCNLGAFFAEEHGVDWYGDLLRIDPDQEMNLAERAREQVAVFVWNVNLSEQRASGTVNGLGSTRYRAFKLLARKFLQADRSMHAIF